MGYISELRKYVGHMPIVHICASVIVEAPDGSILLQKRSDNGMWGYSGGSLELFEKAEDAAVRELYEETGLKALPNELELFGVFSGEALHYTYPNGDEVSTVDIVYICRSYSGVLAQQCDETLELKFFPLNALPDNITPTVKPILKKYIAYRTAETSLRSSV